MTDHDMAQAVSRQPLAAEPRVCSLVSPCDICGGTEVFLRALQLSPVSIIPPGLHVYVIWGMNSRHGGHSSETV